MMDVSLASKGRPREFDAERALDAALRLFWQKGYEGTSLSDLTEVMGIKRPSLYAAFGNKEALFHKALSAYMEDTLHYIRTALEARTARGVAERFLWGALSAQTSSSRPKGCFWVLSCAMHDDTPSSVQATLNAYRRKTQNQFLERFVRAREEGDLPDDIDPNGLTGSLFALAQGMAVQARSGIARGDLERLIEVSLRVWPSR